MKLKITKPLLALLHAASADETRPALNTIMIEPDGTAFATDGRILLTTKVEASTTNKNEKRKLLCSSTLARFVKLIGKKAIGISPGDVEVEIKADRTRFSFKDETLEKDTGKLQDGRYPNVHLVYPPKEPAGGYHRIVIGIPVLKDLIRAAEAMGSWQGAGIAFYASSTPDDQEFNRNPIPVELLGCGVEDGSIKGLVMPIRR